MADVTDATPREGPEGGEEESLQEPLGPQSHVQNPCRFEDTGDAPDWVSLAFRARLRRKVEWAVLAKQFDKDWRTVKLNVQKYASILAIGYEKGDVGALAEYIEGVEDDKSRADEVHGQADEPRDKIACLKQITECRKLIAAAKGVVTERKNVQHSGDEANPVVVKHWWDGIAAIDEEDASGDGGTDAPAA